VSGLDWRLLEYAVWTMIGLWSVLFLSHPWIRLLGALLILFTLVRAATEQVEPGPPRWPRLPRLPREQEPEDTPRRRPPIL